jgi:hypothetical protein
MKSGKVNYSGKIYLKFPADEGFICDRAPAKANLLRGKIRNTLCYELSIAFM